MNGIIKTWEMSGMGRGYEDGCQIMLWTAMKWLEGKPKDIFKGTTTISNVYGLCNTPKQLDIMRDKLLKAVKGCSGAQYHCTIGHASFMHKNGYDAWFNDLKNHRKPTEQYEFNLDTMQLLPELSPEEKKKWFSA